ncbi:helix-hairpin-helix domain-containing protein [Euzebya sp.]|uniref:helix-hairpin-helix domain-containing protein n=1 Tax=Euzebya sp. TaxID=1971409 RepID=UPI00351579D6
MRSHLARLRESLEPVGIAPAEALALLILLAGAAALSGVVWWTNESAAPAPPVASTVEERPGPLEVTPDAPRGPPPGPATPAGDVVGHVAGAVARPGVLTLPAGSRVADAVTAAGGPTPDAVTGALNLARPLEDGEQVHVPAAGEDPPPSAPPPPSAAGDPPGPLDLNTATTAQLEALPGVGPVMAQRIVEHREAIGGYLDVTQLLEVPGIGPGRFAELEPLVSV